MRHAYKGGGHSGASMSRQVRLHPDYNDEISEKYLDEMRKRIDAEKPDNFSLTPVTEPGW